MTSTQTAQRSYAVGYGKPPKHTQFQKGQSGNPSGRRRRSPLEAQIKTDLLKELARPVNLRQDGEVIRVSTLTALIRSTLAQALKGNGPAQRYALTLIQQIQNEAAAEHKELLRVAIETKAAGEKEIARRKRLGITDTSDIVPHPDQILVNMETGEVMLLGLTWPEHAERFAEQQNAASKARKRRKAPDSPPAG